MDIINILNNIDKKYDDDINDKYNYNYIETTINLNNYANHLIDIALLDNYNAEKIISDVIYLMDQYEINKIDILLYEYLEMIEIMDNLINKANESAKLAIYVNNLVDIKINTLLNENDNKF